LRVLPGHVPLSLFSADLFRQLCERTRTIVRAEAKKSALRSDHRSVLIPLNFEALHPCRLSQSLRSALRPECDDAESGVEWRPRTNEARDALDSSASRADAARSDKNAVEADSSARWVKKLIANKRVTDADAYAGHIIDQAVDVLRTQDIGLLTITPPPPLEQIARVDAIIDAKNAARDFLLRLYRAHLIDANELTRSGIKIGMEFKRKELWREDL
jgi:hypothetical protein